MIQRTLNPMDFIESAPEQPGAPPIRWFNNHFWFALSLYAMMLAGMFFIAGLRFTEPDIWWHLKNAEVLLDSGSFSPIDHYSWTASGSAWMNHEWLAEIPFYLAYGALGLRGLFLTYFILHGIIFAGVYYLGILRSGSAKDSICAAFLGMMLSLVSMGPRMLLFGWLCLIVLLIVLEKFDRGNGRVVWALPVLFCLWINLHGSWVFGFVILGIYLFSGTLGRSWGRLEAAQWTRPHLKTLWFATAGCVPALLINPYGYRLPWYPFDMLFAQKINMMRMDEWRALSFQYDYGKIVLFFLVTVLISSIVSQRPWKLHHLLLMFFAVYVGIIHMRFLFFSGIVLAPLLCERVPLMGAYDPAKDRPWFSKALVAAALIYVALFVPKEDYFRNEIAKEYPTEAVEYMRSTKVSGKLFNQYLWGGWLIFHAPEYKPFIDGRADIFVYNGVFEDYLKVVDIKGSFEVLDRHQVQYLLIDPETSLSYMVENHPGWKVIYEDKTAKLYERVARPGVTEGR
jgi:hypothetical protein